MQSDKRQSIALIGIALIAVGAVIIYISLSQPKISASTNGTQFSESISAQSSYSHSEENIEVWESPEKELSEQIEVSQQESESTTVAKDILNHKINLNTATEEELMQINGIGETRAYAIVSYREYLGGYTSTEQLKDIKGIGESLYEKIEPFVTV